MNKPSSAMQLLEKHFDTAFAAPEGIKKLRELILSSGKATFPQVVRFVFLLSQLQNHWSFPNVSIGNMVFSSS
ncbi:MAG: hypothetical protein K0B01_02415 [Syntrophobacterales bacterium]|nr:hypothetical protein [Syntrophobacterales bacterium]